jgi:hypothetical protein
VAELPLGLGLPIVVVDVALGVDKRRAIR